jgi:hypothetical protein
MYVLYYNIINICSPSDIYIYIYIYTAGNPASPAAVPKTHVDAEASDRRGETNDEKKFLTLLFALIDGDRDGIKFEDQCRSLLGGGAFILFTLDKLAAQLIKQVQFILSQDACLKFLGLFHHESSRTGKGSASLFVH